jgi:hypothetical protein
MSKRVYLAVLLNLVAGAGTAIALRTLFGSATIAALGKDSPTVLLGLVSSMAIGVITGVLSAWLLRPKSPSSTVQEIAQQVMRTLRPSRDRPRPPSDLARAA